ncbi:MAG: PIG-L family deacetylase [Bacteroidota bacterium]
MIYLKRILPLLFLVTFLSTEAQKPKRYDAGEVKQLLKKLNVLGTVLYVAAHPDDENTAMISYFANEKLFRTAYLSATRGDGGQNLIGPEIREELGVIRTQELLAARRTDRGRQFFSRANDFGYSKNPDETFTIWDREQVLADFVRVFRKFRPDVVVTRFSEQPPNHGHHTASAILAREAYKLSGDPTKFPEQLKELEPWQPSKVFWNTSPWFFRRRGIPFDTTGTIRVDVGGYNVLFGQSYTEISALSRSMHKSQGFGSTGRRGSNAEYLEQWEGDDSGDLLGGIDTSWDRVEGSEKVAEYLTMAEQNYDAEYPQESLQALIYARRELSRLPDQFWKEVKLEEIDVAIQAISGIYLEVTTDADSYVAGDSVKLQLEAIARSAQGFTLTELRLFPWDKSFEFNLNLPKNERQGHDLALVLPEGSPLSQPYWLMEEASLGMYKVTDSKLIGQPENRTPMSALVLLKYEDQLLEFTLPISYKRNDPVAGEVYSNIAITPPVMVNVESNILVFADDTGKGITVTLKSGKSDVSGVLRPIVPEGWEINPSELPFELDLKGEEQTFAFSIAPSSDQVTVQAAFEAELTNGERYTKGMTVIEYAHIPRQTLFPESKVKLVRVDLKRQGKRIAYIDGAGDLLPTNLSQIGYEVETLSKDDVVAENLRQYDAVLLGVRAFNTVSWLAYKNDELFKYVEQGGTVVVQYNTNRRLVTDQVAPYPLTISRDRVTVEDAEVRILAEDHPAMNAPNKITKKDFEGWVQERGLYFANEWDEAFVPILSSNDPGEEPRDGGLLIAQHGKGYYVYSGYSWFRELPAGIPGPYRILANLLSLSSTSPSN